jgi:undecaprenyl diphosphate synthase
MLQAPVPEPHPRRGPEAGAARHAVDPTRTSDREDWFEEYGIRHVAIIPDGNRRWAREHAVTTEIGHSTGLLQVLPSLVDQLCEAGVHTVTLWGFSTENWTREADEVRHLMQICAHFLCHQVMQLAAKHDARVYHLGRKDRLFKPVLEALEMAERTTANNRSHVYNVALDYGGQDELLRASTRMAHVLAEGRQTKELSVVDFLDTAGQPHPQPDIVVRSSGEQRMSGFMPLQTVYSELFFVDAMFPDMTFEILRDVAEKFRWRKRRFGT